MRRYAFETINGQDQDILPGREGTSEQRPRTIGCLWKRFFIATALHSLRDLPERFGDPIKIHTRFSRWAKSGV